MTPVRWMPFLLAAALLVAAPARAQEGTWYAQALTDGLAGPSVTYFWSQGRSMRAMTVIGGRPIITIVHRDWYYVIDELAGQGAAIQRSNRALAEDADGSRPFAQEARLIQEQGAELVRTQEVSGSTINVYRLSDAQARREVWTPAEGDVIPLRVEIFDRQVNQKHITSYTDWNKNFSIPTRFFRPDARIQLERMTYEEYLRRTTDKALPLPVLYGGLLHGVSREEDS
jgi:hypothetical protein